MTMNPFEQSRQQLLHYLTSNAEQEVIDYIRQEMQHAYHLTRIFPLSIMKDMYNERHAAESLPTIYGNADSI